MPRSFKHISLKKLALSLLYRSFGKYALSFLDANAERYRTPERISFNHRFYGAERTRAEAAIGINQDTPLDDGQDFYMGKTLQGYSVAELIPIFGSAFTRSLGDQPEGKWEGPLLSTRGWHLLQVTERLPARARSREELGAQLANDWRQYQLTLQRRNKLDEILSRYQVMDVP